MIKRLWQTIIMLAVPILLVIGSVRVVMSPLFLQLEYQRPGFPADSYGFSTEDRLQYGVYGVRYILNGADISYLGDRTLPGELCYPRQSSPCAMFNGAELRHMVDVKVVAQEAFLAGVLIALVTAGVSIYLWRSGKHDTLLTGIQRGSLLTLAAIVAILVGAVVAWNAFFDTFHALFFEDGTWRFYYSDTLIRLYPEQFWFDASLVIGVLTVTGAIALYVGAWQLQRRRTLAHPHGK